jgi:hypothetical protein
VNAIETERASERVELAHEPVDLEKRGVGDAIGAAGAQLVVHDRRTIAA